MTLIFSLVPRSFRDILIGFAVARPAIRFSTCYPISTRRNTGAAAIRRAARKARNRRRARRA